MPRSYPVAPDRAHDADFLRKPDVFAVHLHVQSNAPAPTSGLRRTHRWKSLLTSSAKLPLNKFILIQYLTVNFFHLKYPRSSKVAFKFPIDLLPFIELQLEQSN